MLVKIFAFALIAVQFSCQTVGTNSQSLGVQTPLREVNLELSGSIETGEKAPEREGAQGLEGTQGAEVSFRQSLELSPNKTVVIQPYSARDSLRFDAQIAPDPSVTDGEFYIEVTPIDFYSQSVFLQVEIFKKEASGEKVSLSRPRIVAPFGESSEIREFNPSPEADISKLRLSFYPREVPSNAGAPGGGEKGSTSTIQESP